MSEFFVMDGSVRYAFAPPPDRSIVCRTASISPSTARTARACEPWTPRTVRIEDATAYAPR